ncbi:DUF983 domain-containing protein [Dyadobacter flavalbus]|uniref:DUF983 domain-containing protein n=1 Tax=Dyadobacter flavalbus TaxID=2579942 RepID=A0A5M8QN40_9BACT|nr:DUF983 domain-containing protein [Dyadobacter flavalbus]KAA6436678.1 DUF983 domain-containing protein [Dyadobacter flavalbus]
MSKLFNILSLKCPRCRKGKLFTKHNPYSFKGSMEMPKHCPVCDQDFMIEPGFYIGALWTSFPIVILIMAVLSVILLVYFRMDLNWFFVTITVILFLLQPVIIRLGRAIWIHIFVDYEKTFTEK